MYWQRLWWLYTVQTVYELLWAVVRLWPEKSYIYNTILFNNDRFIYGNKALFSKNDDDIIDTKDDIILNPKKENTCILEINIKFGDKNSNFKLRRYDNMFETVEVFCAINNINNNLYIPIIVYIIKALNTIYGIFNLKLFEEEINHILYLKNLYQKTNDDNACI